MNLLFGFSYALEFDLSIGQSEKRIVAAPADIKTRVNSRPALTNYNAAGGHKFSVKPFDAEILRVAITAIAGAASTFFMCHLFSPNDKVV
jgi:hypothetical protein